MAANLVVSADSRKGWLMKTFGYAKKKLSPEGLLEIREVTFSGSPASIREVAQFLLAAAEMEKSGHQFSHVHIGDQCSGWLKKWPDIVVSR
jgi:hypothetical protein